MEGPRRRSTSLFINNGKADAERLELESFGLLNNVCISSRIGFRSQSCHPSSKLDAADYDNENGDDCERYSISTADYTSSSPDYSSSKFNDYNQQRKIYAHRGFDDAQNGGDTVCARVGQSLEKDSTFVAKKDNNYVTNANGKAGKVAAQRRNDDYGEGLAGSSLKKKIPCSNFKDRIGTTNSSGFIGMVGLFDDENEKDGDYDIANNGSPGSVPKLGSIAIARNAVNKARDCFSKVEKHIQVANEMLGKMHKPNQQIPGESLQFLRSHLIDLPEMLINLLQVKEDEILEWAQSKEQDNLEFDALMEAKNELEITLKREKDKPKGLNQFELEQLKQFGVKDVSSLVNRCLHLQAQLESAQRRLKLGGNRSSNLVSRVASFADIKEGCEGNHKDVVNISVNSAQHTVPLPLPDKFKGKSRTELERYLRYFDTAVESRGYDEAAKAAMIGNYLPKLQYTHDKLVKRNASYEEMKRELLNALGSDSSVAKYTLRASLDRITKFDERSYKSMLEEIEQTVSEAYADDNNSSDAELKKILIRLIQEDSNTTFNAAILPHVSESYNRLKELTLGLETSFLLQDSMKKEAEKENSFTNDDYCKSEEEVELNGIISVDAVNLKDEGEVVLIGKGAMLDVLLDGIKTKAMLDTGARVSAISCKALGRILRAIPKPERRIIAEDPESYIYERLIGADGGLLKVVNCVRMPIAWGIYPPKVAKFFVIEDLKQDVLVGTNVLQNDKGWIEALKVTLNDRAVVSSKQPCMLMLNEKAEVQADNWFECLKSDEVWKETCNALSSVKLHKRKKCSFFKKDNFLIKVDYDNRKRKVVPLKYRETLWKGSLKKHGSPAKATRILFDAYFWPGMVRDVHHWKDKAMKAQDDGCIGLLLQQTAKSGDDRRNSENGAVNKRELFCCCEMEAKHVKRENRGEKNRYCNHHGYETCEKPGKKKPQDSSQKEHQELQVNKYRLIPNRREYRGETRNGSQFKINREYSNNRDQRFHQTRTFFRTQQ